MTSPSQRLRRSIRTVRDGALPFILSAPVSGPPPHPMLLFLHGYDEGAPLDITAGLTRHGPLRADIDVPALDAFLLIAPQLPDRGDVWVQYADRVAAIAREAQERAGADRARCYLTGFSFGGNGVFDLALRQREVWAALWAVDPTRVPQADPQRPVWLSIGEVARRRAAAFTRALGARPFAPGGHPDRVVLDEGADHVGSATLAYRDARIYEWLLSKRLDAPAAGAS